MHETINQYEIKCKYVDVVKNILCFLLLQFLNILHFQNIDVILCYWQCGFVVY